MPRDFSSLLWLLKLGVAVNVYFLADLSRLGTRGLDPHLLVPAQILLAVSAFRCLFPNRYKDNVVFHDTPLSSIFLTRLLATFSEVAYIYQFSYVLRVLNVDQVGWIDVLSWWMVVQVVLSQGFVWGSILTGRLALFYYEEFGWAIIFAANTVVSAYLYASAGAGGGQILLLLNLLFGAVYLPWQFIHLRVLWKDAIQSGQKVELGSAVSWSQLKDGLDKSLHVRVRRTSAEDWGHLVGLTWMVAYWATLIPAWVYYVVVVLG